MLIILINFGEFLENKITLIISIKIEESLKNNENFYQIILIYKEDWLIKDLSKFIEISEFIKKYNIIN